MARERDISVLQAAGADLGDALAAWPVDHGV
jgi:hypothetical protein